MLVATSANNVSFYFDLVNFTDIRNNVDVVNDFVGLALHFDPPKTSAEPSFLSLIPQEGAIHIFHVGLYKLTNPICHY